MRRLCGRIIRNEGEFFNKHETHLPSEKTRKIKADKIFTEDILHNVSNGELELGKNSPSNVYILPARDPAQVSKYYTLLNHLGD